MLTRIAPKTEESIAGDINTIPNLLKSTKLLYQMCKISTQEISGILMSSKEIRDNREEEWNSKNP